MARRPIQPPARAGRAEWVDTQALFRNAGVATSYEVQFYREQRWRIDSMFDDGALALHEAKRMSDSGRYVSVRVIEESFDPVTGEPRHATIFRGGRVPEANRKELEDSLKMRRETQTYETDGDEQEERLQNRAGRGARTRESEGYRLPILGICVSVILVLGTLVALHYLRP
jgi:hypothetical protein